MKWIKVPNTGRTQPTEGEYSEWKGQVATDCGHQCVYCAIPENKYGGLDNYHVEHFRPKSIRKFAKLKNKIENLFLACAICNRFKSNDWPSDPATDNSVVAHIDPSIHDYNDVFDLNPKTFIIAGRAIAAKYVVERLYLNRPQLIFERRTFAATKRIEEFEKFAHDSLAALANLRSPEAFDLLHKLLAAILDISSAERQNASLPPYQLHEIKRQTKAKKRSIRKKKATS